MAQACRLIGSSSTALNDWTLPLMPLSPPLPIKRGSHDQAAMINATVTIKKLTSCIVYDAIGISAARIHESAEEMFCDDEEVTCINIIVLQ
jgi:hypothetical protein